MQGPIDMQPVIDALRTAVPALRQIGGAADFAAASKATAPVTPALFVLLATESAKPQSGGSATAVQAITARIAVLIAARNYRASGRGTQSAVQLHDLIASVRLALLGKVPPGFAPGQASAIELVSGALINYADATTWWQEIFQTTYWSRA